jgi:5-formyltetrahydrofolate cyclo-ligase
MAQPTPETRALRRRLKDLRRAIPLRERRVAERSIARALRRLSVFRPSARIAVYLAMPGEADLSPALAMARAAGTRIYVPRIDNRRRRDMSFVPLVAGAALRATVLGIREPVTAARTRIDLSRLDSILVPMVGFDRECNRLGMGGGFYDRALRKLRRNDRRWRRPRLIGIAFACQETDRIVPAPWDVALDQVVTERDVIDARPARASDRPRSSE